MKTCQSCWGRNHSDRCKPDGLSVHSMGNVAIFDTEARMPADKISFALNQRLPADIVVQDSCEVPPDWHRDIRSAGKHMSTAF